MDRRTKQVYENKARQWIDARNPRHIDNGRLAAFAARLAPDATVVDLGCGPGWYGEWLRNHGFRVAALDVSRSMLDHARSRSPRLGCVQADLATLPFRPRSLGGAWASSSYQHLPCPELPLALAELHWALEPNSPVELSLANLEAVEHSPAERNRGETQRRFDDSTFGKRLFSLHTRQRAQDLFVGAGFTELAIDDASENPFWLIVRARRALTLPDLIGPRLRLLVCGLNPSILSAQRGIGFARPGNRFWPAMQAAGLVDIVRDPRHALARGIGMTDLVKRATPSSSELDRGEYVEGVNRLERLVRLHRPRTVCFVGLEGWRLAVDRKAKPGWVANGFAGRPAYLMPSTSGRNASARLDDLVSHLQRAAAADGAA